MDPKAAAKSKRTHTVHGRRSHPTPSAAAAHKQKRASSSSTSTPSSSARARNLPSNWDRYDAEAAADDSAAAPSAAWPGEAAPRSKGADFAFLLEQARAQPREERSLDAPWLASGDSSFDFMQGSASMLAARGDGILSWCQDDNFFIDDDSVQGFEVPFLSMDLHALAIQLSKLKLSQRLFIEDDLLPDNLADGSGGNQLSSEPGTSTESESKDGLVQQRIVSDREPGKDVISHGCASKFRSDQIKQDIPLQYSEGEKSATLHGSNTQLEHPNCGEINSYSVSRIVVSGIDVDQSKASSFEVSAAEEELDTLLNSFSKTHLSSSNLNESFGNNAAFRSMKVSESNEEVTSTTSSRPLAVSPLDEALDDLLSETSMSIQDKGYAATLSAVGDFASTNSTSQPTFNSYHDINFRSAKQIDITSLDDSVDDLLADTSLCMKDQNQTTSAHEQGNIPSVKVTSHSAPPNASDDFDSWFDSL